MLNNKAHRVYTLSLVFLYAFLSLSLGLDIYAQEKVVLNDTTASQMLNELQIIRGIQENSYLSRMRSIEERHRKDSIENKTFDDGLSSDYGMMARIEDNTHPRPWEDGWNFYGIIAFFLALLSLCVSWATLHSQKKTESNTQRLSKDMQKRLLHELLRHLYRNFVIIYAMKTKMADNNYNGYPSEEHFEKLKTPLNNIHLEAFYKSDIEFQNMHALYLYLRNFNMEVDVIREHMTNSQLNEQIKKEDFGILEFKVSFLTKEIVIAIRNIWGKNEKTNNDIKKAITSFDRSETHISNNTDNYDISEELNIKDLSITAYNDIYSPKELIQFCEVFNRDVKEERGVNERGIPKIRIIKP